MLLQIRIYTINRGALELFSQEWTEKNDRDWERLDSAYHGSEDRQAMDPDPARNIARMEHYFIEKVL